MSAGRLFSIQISDGGVPKEPVDEARISAAGLAGDRQRDLRYHGGPDRAVSLFSLDRIEALRREGHPIAPGSTGENLTLTGLDWDAVRPGAELRVGPVRLAVTAFAAPCENVAPSFAGGDLTRISQKLHPGWSRVYARVLEGGLVRPGDPVVLGVGTAAAAPTGWARVRAGERFTREVALSPAAVSGMSSALGDENPIHHDPAAAAATRYGRVIASGAHTGALLMALTATHFSGRANVVGLGFSLRFVRPVFADETVLLEWVVERVTPSTKLGGDLVDMRGTVYGRDGEPSVAATGRVLVTERL